jgi:hypothetical protein
MGHLFPTGFGKHFVTSWEATRRRRGYSPCTSLMVFAGISSLILSDGIHFIQAMLATQINRLVTENLVDKLSVIRLDNYACNVVQNRKCVSGVLLYASSFLCCSMDV